MTDLNAITELIAAVAGLLTAAGVFLSVLPKLGVHSDKLDQLDAKVTALAGDATTVAAEAKAVAPVLMGAVPATPPAAVPGLPAETSAAPVAPTPPAVP